MMSQTYFLSPINPLGNYAKKTNICLFSNDKIGDNTIVDIYAEDDNSVRIKSNNIMGFVGRKKQQLKIYSRFDDEEHDLFLHYMLQKVFSYNIFNPSLIPH